MKELIVLLNDYSGNDTLINTKHRVSMWLNGEANYLMPCEFLDIQNSGLVKLMVLDPDNFVGEHLLNKQFNFGNIHRILITGTLKEIVR